MGYKIEISDYSNDIYHAAYKYDMLHGITICYDITNNNIFELRTWMNSALWISTFHGINLEFFYE